MSKEGKHKGDREGALGGMRGEESRNGAAAHGGRRGWRGGGHGKRKGRRLSAMKQRKLSFSLLLSFSLYSFQTKSRRALSDAPFITNAPPFNCYRGLPSFASNMPAFSIADCF